MKKIIVILIFFIFQLSNAQLVNRSFEEVDTLSVKKPLVVFLHTDWCKYCHVMQETTFKNKEVINKLNSNFYFISFDAESTENVEFKGKLFTFKPTGKKTGLHEIAEILGKYNNKIEYPTTVVLNTKNEIVFQHPSMLKPKEFIKLLKVIETHEEF